MDKKYKYTYHKEHGGRQQSYPCVYHLRATQCLYLVRAAVLYFYDVFMHLFVFVDFFQGFSFSSSFEYPLVLFATFCTIAEEKRLLIYIILR